MPCQQITNADISYSPPLSSRTGPFATEADCLNACKEGACCEGATCSIKPQCQCQGAGKVFKGVGTTCSPNPCPPACMTACPTLPQQLTFSVSGPTESGNPFVDQSPFVDNFFGTVTKKQSISFAAVDFSYVFDIDTLFSQASGFLNAYRNTDTGLMNGDVEQLGEDLGGLDSFRVDWSSGPSACSVWVRAHQIAFTMQPSQNGPNALPGYAYELRAAEAFVSFSSSGLYAWTERGWTGQGYAYAQGQAKPFEKRRRQYQELSPVSCLSHSATPIESTQGVGGFPGDLFQDVSGFCLIPVPDPDDPPPTVGGEYGYMVGFVGNCQSAWRGNLRRVASFLSFADVEIE